MSVARAISRQLEHASWIRKMFEEGARLKAERGPGAVFDFTLGNPSDPPPEPVLAALRRIALEAPPRNHGYMPNAGYPEVREVVARKLSRRTGLPYTAGHILMTSGSAAAINVFLKAILDVGDEVIVPVPCFPEYRFYIENHSGRMFSVETTESFQLDLARIEQALTDRTRALILNSPHNPTGVVYPVDGLRELDGMLSRFPRPVTVISDEPYRELVYGDPAPEIPAIFTRAVIADSWSKAFAIAGERIGYLAISPRIPEARELAAACTFTNRVLGFVNAPAIWQRVIAETIDVRTEVEAYREKMDLMCDGLERIGYELLRPRGAFYVFPKTPIADDIAYVALLRREGILAVPGTGFGRAGYIRLSLTVPKHTITASLPAFDRAFHTATDAKTGLLASEP